MVVALGAQDGLNGYRLQTADQSGVRKRLRATERVSKLNAFRKATVFVFFLVRRKIEKRGEGGSKGSRNSHAKGPDFTEAALYYDLREQHL